MIYIYIHSVAKSPSFIGRPTVKALLSALLAATVKGEACGRGVFSFLGFKFGISGGRRGLRVGLRALAGLRQELFGSIVKAPREAQNSRIRVFRCIDGELRTARASEFSRRISQVKKHSESLKFPNASPSEPQSSSCNQCHSSLERSSLRV